jgi:hypothetical protein
MGLPIIYRQRCTSPTATHADYPDLRASPTPPPRQEAAQNGGSARIIFVGVRHLEAYAKPL